MPAATAPVAAPAAISTAASQILRRLSPRMEMPCVTSRAPRPSVSGREEADDQRSEGEHPLYGRLARVGTFGEELPNIENRIEPVNDKDEFGMPLAKIIHSYDKD